MVELRFGIPASAIVIIEEAVKQEHEFVCDSLWMNLGCNTGVTSLTVEFFITVTLPVCQVVMECLAAFECAICVICFFALMNFR